MTPPLAPGLRRSVFAFTSKTLDPLPRRTTSALSVVPSAMRVPAPTRTVPPDSPAERSPSAVTLLKRACLRTAKPQAPRGTSEHGSTVTMPLLLDSRHSLAVPWPVPSSSATAVKRVGAVSACVRLSSTVVDPPGGTACVVCSTPRSAPVADP